MSAMRLFPVLCVVLLGTRPALAQVSEATDAGALTIEGCIDWLLTNPPPPGVQQDAASVPSVYLTQWKAEPHAAYLFAVAREATAAERDQLIAAIRQCCEDYLTRYPLTRGANEGYTPPTVTTIDATGAAVFPVVLYEAGMDRRELLGLMAAMHLRCQEAHREKFRAETGKSFDLPGPIGAASEYQRAYLTGLVFNHFLAMGDDLTRALSAGQARALQEYKALVEADAQRKTDLSGREDLAARRTDIVLPLLEAFALKE